VLLYALLCGCLPFDDNSNNMAVIYRKIQSGRFAVPKWLSVESVDLLHDLMQVSPRRRITVRELVRHPWVVKGFGVPVSWQSNCQVSTDYICQHIRSVCSLRLFSIIILHTVDLSCVYECSDCISSYDTPGTVHRGLDPLPWF